MNENQKYLDQAVEITLRLGILVFIFGWVFLILAPFLSPVLWGLIIAVSIFPLFTRLKDKLKGRAKLAAVLLSGLIIALLLVPMWMLADSLFEGIASLREYYASEHFTIPPPGNQVKDWPAIAKPVVDIWDMASKNLQSVVVKFTPQIKTAGGWLLSAATSTGLGMLQLIVSVILAGVFMVYSDEGGKSIKKIYVKLAGSQGEHFADLSEKTIRTVVKGVLGVAAIQTFLAGAGFVIAGVPLAGLWTLLCLIFAIVQVGIGPVALCVIIYMYATASTMTATILMVWLVLVTLVDNVLKPLLLGRGSQVPMLVVFLGSLGGFVANGFMGLFLGPVILSLAYKLFQAWVEE